MEQFFKEYIDLIKQKHQWNKTTAGLDFLDPHHRLKELGNETQEVSDELKPNNQIYLEDELGDIFRDYMNLLIVLQDNGYISNPKDILFKSYEKFHERISVILDKTDKPSSDLARNEIKKLQKQSLKDKHNSLYS